MPYIQQIEMFTIKLSGAEPTIQDIMERTGSVLKIVPKATEELAKFYHIVDIFLNLACISAYLYYNLSCKDTYF